MVNEKAKKLIKELYESAQEDLEEVENQIDEYGILDNGVSDVEETFEQGYVNGVYQVCKILGIDL